MIHQISHSQDSRNHLIDEMTDNIQYFQQITHNDFKPESEV